MKSTRLTSTHVDSASLADELARFRVISASRLTGLLADFPGGGPAALAEFLVGRGALTAFQADRALAGEAHLLALGPYRLTGVRGRGVSGPLFQAEKDGGNGAYAISVVPLRSLWQAKQAKHLARALAALPTHPAVVPLVDADSANGYHFLVWPAAAGTLLAERVAADGPLSPIAVSFLLAQLSAGLAMCHDRQVIHGLLSPMAVLLSPDPAAVAKVVELGTGMLLARNLAAEESMFDTRSTAVAVAGVLEYAAPEWLLDPSAAGPAGDQYALGAIGYFALAGRPPSPPRTGASPSLAKENPAIPGELAAAIDQMLQFDPADRFSGMDEVRDTFAKLTGHPDMMELLCPRSALVAEVANRRSGEQSVGSKQGQVSWSGGGGVSHIPARDDSDASIRFDLPDLPLPPPSAALGPAARSDVSRNYTARPPGDGPTSSAGPVPVIPPSEAAAPALPVLPNPPIPPAASSAALPPPGPEIHSAPPSSSPLPPDAPLLGKAALERDRSSNESAAHPRPQAVERPSATGSSELPLWKKLKRQVLFWQAPVRDDTIRVSVFGPAAAALSESPKLTVYLHAPAAAESVETLARAFQNDAELLGTGTMTLPIARGTQLAVHLAVAHAAVTTPLASFAWKGQPHRLVFDLVIPWGAPDGPALGVVSVGKDDVRLGLAEFYLQIKDGQ